MDDAAPQRIAPRSPSEALKPTAAPPPPPRVQRPRGGMLSAISGLLSLALIVALGAILGVIYVERRVGEPGPLAADKVVVIPRSTGTGEMAELLKR
ncbi:MAG: aminodeoxychorismate lyase, partial [Microvirga sp.]